MHGELNTLVKNFIVNSSCLHKELQFTLNIDACCKINLQSEPLFRPNPLNVSLN